MQQCEFLHYDSDSDGCFSTYKNYITAILITNYDIKYLKLMIVMFLPTILNVALKLSWVMKMMQGNGCNSIITIHKLSA